MRDSHKVMTAVVIILSSNCCCGDFSAILWICRCCIPLLSSDLHVLEAKKREIDVDGWPMWICLRGSFALFHDNV